MKKAEPIEYDSTPFPQPASWQETEPGGFDVAIIGGGLAGLALSIQCAQAGFSTILFEKEQYPFHRVCGEYISMESWNFLEELGLPLSDMNPPHIKQLLVSAPNGQSIEQELPLGGFGLSRYTMDHELAGIARKAGVALYDSTKVTDVQFDGSLFTIFSEKIKCSAKVCCGTFGKRSNLDVKWHRPFIRRKPNKLNHYIGIKYHILIDSPQDFIFLHNFPGGYCGLSRVENDQYCLCYLTTAHNLQKNGNSIQEMEKTVLMTNPFLKEIFERAAWVREEPIVISQISFEKKSLIEHHILMIGDSAGMITPLCGNGMSMALHGAKLAFKEIEAFLSGKTTRSGMEHAYLKQWKSNFASRLRTGRAIQHFFGDPFLSNLMINFLRPFPAIQRWLIRQTHGEPF